MNIRRILIGAFMLCFALPAAAQNTGGVFGPVVNEGHASMNYRAAYDFDSYGFAQRFHYQRALNDDFMWRAIVQARKTDDSDVDADFIQGEFFWQLDDISDRWRHGVRFDVRIRTEGRPGAVGVNWASEFDLGTDWVARLAVLAATEVGDGASGDVFVQTRAMAIRPVTGKIRLGAEMFNTYGAIDDIPGFSEQFHQAGPIMTVNLGSGWSLFASALFGVSSATPDLQGRLWITRSL